MVVLVLDWHLQKKRGELVSTKYNGKRQSVISYLQNTIFFYYLMLNSNV
jgi:hypothetical protein